MVKEIISQLRKRYGKYTNLTVHRGEVYEYLKMKLGYQTQGKVKIYMTEYLSKILKDVPEKHKVHTVMPAENHLFEVK